MNNSAQFLKIELLYKQKRYQEAKSLLEEFLTENPNDFRGRIYFVSVLRLCGEKETARDLCDALIGEYPDSIGALSLSIQIDLDDAYYEKAESKIELLQEMAPTDSDTFVLAAQAKLGQRNYDKALIATDRALALEPDNLEALNLKILIEGILGKGNTRKSIEHALQLDPESAHTKANHALHLLREGKVQQALERAGEALSQEPNNEAARYVMAEAMKSKFWLFRMFFKYKEFVAKLTARGSWTMIIGVYILYRLIISASESYPILLPLVYLLVALFVLSWLIDPLANLFLYFNKYGRLLLEKKGKIMALSVGTTLLLALICLILLLAFDDEMAGAAGLMFAIFAIPLSSFLHPTKKANQNILQYFTAAIIVSGLIGAFIMPSPFMYLAILGVFVFQFVVNGMLIKENSRVID